jgi:hypothetical protein
LKEEPQPPSVFLWFRRPKEPMVKKGPLVKKEPMVKKERLH